MSKTILVTGSTDGIGLLTAKKLVSMGHTVLLHGRSQTKLANAKAEVGAGATGYLADFSDVSDVERMAEKIVNEHQRLDVLVNNAGIFKAREARTKGGLDIRFAVNTLAPHALTKRLLPILPKDGRVVSLSSAAQSPVDVDALQGKYQLDDFEAYAQSKLAITIWSQEMAARHPEGPVFIAVNPGSLLASKMVKEGFGVPGKDLSIGANILVEASLSPRFAEATGRYFDNDAGAFRAPHAAAASPGHVRDVMAAIEQTAVSIPAS